MLIHSILTFTHYYVTLIFQASKRLRFDHKNIRGREIEGRTQSRDLALHDARVEAHHGGVGHRLARGHGIR